MEGIPLCLLPNKLNYGMLYSATLCYAMLHCNILYYIVLYSTILYYIILYCNILYYKEGVPQISSCYIFLYDIFVLIW